MASSLPTTTTTVFVLLLALSVHPIRSADHHFVLIHGLGHGAWCWYRLIALLHAAGASATAIDLTSNGISKVVADSVTSVAEYSRPLTGFLANNVTSMQKVILVGHSLGGGSVSYAMELFPEKISKAIFLVAFMPPNGQVFGDLPGFQETLLHNLQIGLFGEIFADASSSIPTSLYINVTMAKNYFYNKSPLEDAKLAETLLNPTPFRIFEVILNLTAENYGSIKRYYIRTSSSDRVIPLRSQNIIIEQNPPHAVFDIKNSDHSAFFSEPVALVTVLLSIASS